MARASRSGMNMEAPSTDRESSTYECMARPAACMHAAVQSAHATSAGRNEATATSEGTDSGSGVLIRDRRAVVYLNALL